MTPAPRPDAPPDSDVAPLLAALDSRGFIPDAEAARSAWRRAAALRYADPALFDRVAAALLGAVRRARPLDREAAAVAWCCRAEALNARGRLRRSRAAFVRSLELARRAGARDVEARSLTGLVHVLALLGEERQAARLARSAERILTRSGDLGELGRLLMNRGNLLYQQDRYREADRIYARAEEAMERAGLRDAAWVGLLMNRAVAATSLEQLAAGRSLLERAAAEARRLDQPFLESFAHYNRAFLEAQRGEYRAALALLEKATPVFARQAVLDMAAAADRARAEIYLDLGMPGEAIDLAGRATRRFDDLGMALDSAICRLIEARAGMALGRAKEAMRVFGDLRRFFARHRNRPRAAAVTLMMAEAERRSGRFRAAGMLAAKAGRSFEALGLDQWAVQAWIAAAGARLAQGRWAEAGGLLDGALRQGSSLPLGVRQDLWAAAGRLARARGDWPEARRRLERAARLLEVRRRFIPGETLRTRRFEADVEIYHELVAGHLERPPASFDALFPLVERARARTFRDRMAGGGQPDGRWEERRALLGALTRRIDEEEFSGAADEESRRRMGGLRRRAVAIERSLVRERLRREEREGGGPAAAPEPTATEVAARLKRDEAVLEYFVTRTGVLALVLGAGTRVVHPLSTPLSWITAAILRLERHFETMAATAATGGGNLAFQRRFADAVLRSLYAALVEPVASSLPRSGRLFLVPHGVLHRVPFECLRDDEDYVNSRWRMNRLPMAGMLASTPVRRRRSGPVLIASTVTGGPPHAAAEASRVAARFAGRDVRVLNDPPTPDLLAAMADARVVHITTHGHFRADNPSFSRLATGDGSVFLADIMDRRLDADLVVLGACESGRVAAGPGDELSGVAHGFLSAGARTLVASRWRVHDEATLGLIDAFYREYTGGAAAGDAAGSLARAARDLRAAWDHPFHWGVFSVFGGPAGGGRVRPPPSR